MRLSEKVTVINYNEEDSKAYILTYNVSLITKLDRYVKEGRIKLKRIISEDVASKEYIVPKSWVSVRPKKVMNLSDEERQARTERLSVARTVLAL